MAFSGGSDTVDPGMRRLSMVEFTSPQPNGAVNQFAFDPSLGALDSSMNGQFGDQLAHMQSKNNHIAGLSVDTQYPNAIDFSQLSASGVFQSPFDTDFNNPFPNNSGTMGLDMNTMMSEDLTAMSEMFSAQQFGSPTFNSPMTATFGNSMYGQQDPSGGAMATGAQLNTMMTATTTPTGFQMRGLTAPESSFRPPPQPTKPISSSKTSGPEVRLPSTTASSAKPKSSQPPSQATIGGISLPWHTPAGIVPHT
jgi:hypothetical protein